MTKNIGGAVSLVVLAGLIGLAISVTNDATPLWGILLLCVHGANFPWEHGGVASAVKNGGASLALAACMGTIGYTVYFTKDASPLWAVLLVVIFAANFPWSSRTPKKAA